MEEKKYIDQMLVKAMQQPSCYYVGLTVDARDAAGGWYAAKVGFYLGVVFIFLIVNGACIAPISIKWSISQKTSDFDGCYAKNARSSPLLLPIFPLYPARG